MWIMIFLLPIFGGVIAGIISLKKKKEKLQSAELVLKQNGMTFSDTTQLTNTMLIWDEKRSQIAIIEQLNSNMKSHIFDYNSIRDAEIIKDGEIIFKKSAMRTVGGAIVGGVLLGGAGAIVGGLSGATTAKEKLNSLSLKIYFNSIETPSLTIEFISKMTPDILKTKLIIDATKWRDRLIAIIDSLYVPEIKQPEYKSLISGSIADELKKYKDLLDSGAISVEEYEKQKTKFLS